MKIAVLYTEEFLYHETPVGWPECPERLEVIMRELEKSGFLRTGSCDLIEPRRATLDELTMLHDRGYVKWIEEVCESGGGAVGLEAWASPGTFEAAAYAVGASIMATGLVIEGRYDACLALVRPPGHHAGRQHAKGYCIFNNVALAAQHLLEQHGLRVAILDVDAHHGDGTQDFFYGTDEVLYVSLHQDPRLFPGRGFEDEVGSGPGEGYNVNIPLPFFTADDIYLRALESIAVPVVEQYVPDIILVSLGLDHHYADPVGRLALSMLGHARAFYTIVELAQRACGGRLVAVLEGGYSLTRIGKMLAADLAVLLGRRYGLPDEPTETPPRTRAKAEAVLRKVRRIQSEYWGL